MNYPPNMVCVACNKPAWRAKRSMTLCVICASDLHSAGAVAIALVAREIRAGRMQKATAHACVDCGRQAAEYDHRDYERPLDVVPTCCSCNRKRGHAKWHSHYAAPVCAEAT